MERVVDILQPFKLPGKSGFTSGMLDDYHTYDFGPSKRRLKCTYSTPSDADTLDFTYA